MDLGDFIPKGLSKMLKYCTEFNVNVAGLTYFQNGAIHVPPRKWVRAG